ncbi:MAG: hypothetical protein ABSG43_17980, partial [Solirubrobacteraceae bacterium]
GIRLVVERSSAAVTVAASRVASNAPSARFATRRLGLLGLVSDARERDHGPISSATAIFSYERACSRFGWDVPDGFSIACAPACSCIAVRVCALNDSKEM